MVGGSRVKHGLAVLLALAVLTVAIGVAMWLYPFWPELKAEVISRGVIVGSIPVGGLPPGEAAEKIKREAWPALDQKVVFRLGKKEWSTSLRELGVSLQVERAVESALGLSRDKPLWERIKFLHQASRREYRVPLYYSYDLVFLEEAILGLTADYGVRPLEPLLVTKQGGGVQVVGEGKSGLRVNARKAAADLASRLEEGCLALDTSSFWVLPVETEVVPPQLTNRTAEEIKINGLLASFRTQFNPANVNRTFNIKVAAEALNHLVIRPGETFSFNRIVGPRSQEAGYKEALVIVNQEFVPGLGGGVCQVSSTLYNVLLRANIPVVERHHHSLPVDYVPLGCDAAVTYGQRDLRFVNNTSGPLVLQTQVGESSLLIQLFGNVNDSPRAQVEIVTETLEEIKPRRVEKPNPGLPFGQEIIEQKGRAGARVQVYRIIKSSGKVKKELLSTNTYYPVDEIVQVGTGAEPAEPAEPQEPPESPADSQTHEAGPEDSSQAQQDEDQQKQD